MTESRIRVHVTDNFHMDGVSVYMGIRLSEHEMNAVHFNEHGHQIIQYLDQPVVSDPTFVLSNDFGRALLDALLRYYQGASDMHTLRSDYLHERGRVDKFIEAILNQSGR